MNKTDTEVSFQLTKISMPLKILVVVNLFLPKKHMKLLKRRKIIL